MSWWQLALSGLSALVVVWLGLVAALWVTGRRISVTEAVRLGPDVVRLVARLSRDPELPRGVRWRLWLLLGYLLLPIDLVPDFLPVIGYADDAIVVAVVLRSVVRAAGPEALTRHWPGSTDGLVVVRRLAGLDPAG